MCSDECRRERTRRRVALIRAKERAERRRCAICGADISHKRKSARFCGQECWWKHHYSQPENQERRKANSRRHKAENRERHRETSRAYNARPENKARKRALRKARKPPRQCEQCKVSIAGLHLNSRFCSKECWKASYYQRPEVQERIQKARESPEARKWMRDYGQRPEVKARKRAAYRKHYARKKAEREAQKQAEGAERGEA